MVWADPAELLKGKFLHVMLDGSPQAPGTCAPPEGFFDEAVELPAGEYYP